MSIDVLKEQIKSKNIGNLYLFCGPEEYLKRYYLNSIEKLLIDENFKELNKTVLEGKVDLNRLSDYCEAMPVFSDKKIVVVKNSGLFKPKKKTGTDDLKETKNKAQNDQLTIYLQAVPDHTCLIFYEDEVDKRLKALDVIKKKGLLVEFALQKPPELVKWVTRVFKSYSKDIDSMTASRLVESCEQSMTELYNEINKVVMYLGDRNKVTGTDIEKICTKSIKSKIFDLTDAVAEKNAGKAVKLLDDMITLKEPLPKILFMLTRQFRQILEMKLLKKEGLSTDEAAKKMGMTPFASGKIAKQASGISEDTLKKAIKESLELDLAIKTGRMNDRTAVEILITHFSTN